MDNSFTGFLIGACIFIALLFVIWILDNYYRHRDDEMEVIKGNQDIKLKEREIIEKYVERGGELPHKEKYREIDHGRNRV